MRLGHICAKYESAREGVGTISSGHGDPGGKSYGIFQFASRRGGLKGYVRNSAYRRILEKHPLASKKFDEVWKHLACVYPGDFEADQYAYTHKRYYVPLRNYANKAGVLNTRAINEALFSMSVQHGMAYKIVRDAGILPKDNEYETIVKLYAQRKAYVIGLSGTAKLPKRTMIAVENRYRREQRDVLALINKKKRAPAKVKEVNPKKAPKEAKAEKKRKKFSWKFLKFWK